MNPVRLEGSVCVLRDWRPEDISSYRDWLAPHHSWHDTNGPYFARPDQRRIDEMVAVAVALAGGDELPVPRERSVIADAVDDRLVGRVSWYWEAEETDWRRIGIGVYDPDARGRGIGREALSLWADYLFAATDALRLDLGTYSGNIGMCRAAEAAGFVLEARMRQARRWTGGVHDALVYGMLRDERP